MGACFSEFERDNSYPTAKVISTNGDLHEYPVPVTVSQVLQSEPSPSASSSLAGYFVCNSDGLYYEERIPALANGDELVGNQIYFVLPDSKLEGRLTAPEMAALAVKASLALRKAEEKGGGKGRRTRTRKASIRISPVVEISGGGSCGDGVMMDGGDYGNMNDVVDRGRGSSSEGINGRVLRSGSFRKKQRVAPSKRAKVGFRPYRTRLSTIHEDTIM